MLSHSCTPSILRFYHELELLYYELWPEVLSVPSANYVERKSVVSLEFYANCFSHNLKGGKKKP